MKYAAAYAVNLLRTALKGIPLIDMIKVGFTLKGTA